MLNNAKIISRMTLEEKIKMIVSNAMDGIVPGFFEFPKLSLAANALLSLDGLEITYKGLAQTLNSETIVTSAELVSYELMMTKPYSLYLVDPYQYKELISKDTYTASYVLKYFLKGNKKYGYNVLDLNQYVIEEDYKKDEYLKIYDSLLEEKDIDSIVVHSYDEIKFIKKHYGDSFSYITTSIDIPDLIKSLKSGALAVLAGEENYQFVYEGLLQSVMQSIDARRNFELNYINATTLSEVEEENLSLDMLNTIVDRIIDIYISRAHANKVNNTSEITDLAKFDYDDADFEEKLDVLKNLALESTLLYKNEDNILPLKRNTNYIIIGHNANIKEDIDILKKGVVKRPTLLECLAENENYIFEHYEMIYEENFSKDIFNQSLHKIDEKTVVYYANCVDGKITDLDVELINEYSGYTDVIAIVPGDVENAAVINAKAIIFNGGCGNMKEAALAELLLGHIDFSGRSFDMSYADKAYCGLSYTAFEYVNIELLKERVYFTANNVLNTDGICVAMQFTNNELSGFVKAPIEANSYKKLYIPFKESSVKTYSEINECYIINGMEYPIYIGEGYDSYSLGCDIKLEEKLFNEDKSAPDYTDQNIYLDDRDNKMKDVNHYNDKKALYKSVMILFGVLEAFIVVFMVFAIISGMVSDVSIPTIIILVTLVMYIILLVVCLKYKKRTNDVQTLSKMMNKIGLFDERDKITYERPVEPEVKEEEEAEATEEDLDIEDVSDDDEVLDGDYDDGVEEGEEELQDEASTSEIERQYIEVESKNITLEDDYIKYDDIIDLYNDLNQYIKEQGLQFTPASLKNLLGAICSSQIVRFDNNENSMELLTKVCQYFSDCNVIYNVNDGNVDDVYNENDSLYQAIMYAIENPNELVLLPIINTTDEFITAIRQILVHATNQLAIHSIISSNRRIKLPNNIKYIISNTSLSDLNNYLLINASIYANVTGESKEFEGEYMPHKKLRYIDLQTLINRSCDKYFLDENTFSHIDDFEDELKKLETFKFSNKTALQIEILQSVLIALDMDEQDTVDYTFEAKLLDLVKLCATYKKDKGDKLILDILKRVIGEDYLKRTRLNILKKEEALEV